MTSKRTTLAAHVVFLVTTRGAHQEVRPSWTLAVLLVETRFKEALAMVAMRLLATLWATKGQNSLR